METAKTNFLEMNDISFYRVITLLIIPVLFVLTTTVILIWTTRKRQKYEMPIFVELMNNVVILDFFFLLNTCNLKLKLYRSFCNVTLTLEEFHRKLKCRLPGESDLGLAKIIAQQIEFSCRIIYNPDITHLLYDTDDMTISDDGMASLQSFREEFYKSMKKYGKTIRLDKPEPLFTYSQNPKRRLPRTGPILIMK